MIGIQPARRFQRLDDFEGARLGLTLARPLVPGRTSMSASA
jgi:hypothetical protein